MNLPELPTGLFIILSLTSAFWGELQVKWDWAGRVIWAANSFKCFIMKIEGAEGISQLGYPV